MIKKISAFLVAMALAVGTLTACSNKDNSSSKTESAATSASDESTTETPEPSLTIDGKKVDTKDLILCTVDGRDIDFDTFRYYYYYTMSSYGITAESISGIEGQFETLLDEVVKNIKNEFVAQDLAKENNITLTDDDKEDIDAQIKKVQSNYESEEDYKTALKQSYLTEDLYKKMLEYSKIYEKVDSTLFKNEGKYATKKDDFKKIVQDTDEYARVIHILIPYECQAEITDDTDSYESASLSEKLTAKKNAYNALSEDEQAKAKESAKKLANDILKKAKNGDDFESLMEEYGWDPGMETSPDGYYINKDTSFVQEFKDAAFKLKENEISDLVENTSYGWFIIKRLPVDMDYVDENIDSLIEDYDTPKISQLYQEMVDKMDVTYTDIYKKITADSIT